MKQTTGGSAPASFKKWFMSSMKCNSNIPQAVLTMIIGLIFISGKANGQELNDTLKDKDGNTYTIKILPDNKRWMTVNLKIKIPGSYCYENAAENCNRYGRLYAWKAAQEGCKLLGTGWRLPTNEEWRQMARWYGGIYGDSADSGKTAFKALLHGGKAGLNTLLGGGRDPDADKYARLEAHGFYWTATEFDPASAWYLNFGKGSGKLYDQDGGEKQRAFSVRCVCDAGGLK